MAIMRVSPEVLSTVSTPCIPRPVLRNHQTPIGSLDSESPPHNEPVRYQPWRNP